MANNITAFFERLTAAAGEYNKAKVGALGALDSVFLDVRPEVARQGQTIRVYFPDVQAFSDQAANDWNPEDVNPGFVDVPFGLRPGKAILVRDFEQFQTSTDIIDQFIDPNFKRAMEFANQQVFNLVTPTNFNVYPPIQTVPGEVDIGSAKLAWNLLVRNKIPIQDDTNSTMLYHPDVHANTLTDPAWSQENLVSAVIALETRTQAATPSNEGVGMMGQSTQATTANRAFKFTRRYDQQATTGTTALTGTISITNGQTAITGTGTHFTTQLSAVPVAGTNQIGNTTWVTFGTDTVSYPVTSVTSDTAANLGQPYQGVTAGSATAVRVSYTGVAMHRFAIALAVRPLEIVNNGQVSSRLVMMRGLPMRLMLSYQHLKAGWLMTLDYGMVAKVIRPDFGVILQS